MLQKDDKVIVGLSGGADSIALILLLKDLGYPCIAAHCNFQLRGKEADRDESFVQSFCNQQQIPLHIIHFDTYQYAENPKVAMEMA